MKADEWVRQIVTGALVLALVPATVAAQDAESDIQNTLEQAEQAGIPVALLQSLVDEGTAKDIPMDRIAAAVQARLDGLVRAQQALADVPEVEAGDLEVAADALESGVSEAVLAEIALTAPAERRAVAIAALGYLVDAGIVPEEARDRVQEALAQGPEALQNLPAQVPTGVPGGVPGDVGAPSGVPAPGGVPAGGRPDGAGPPSGTPTGGPPSGLPGD